LVLGSNPPLQNDEPLFFPDSFVSLPGKKYFGDKMDTVIMKVYNQEKVVEKEKSGAEDSAWSEPIRLNEN
jgi:hypothetical protein